MFTVSTPQLDEIKSVLSGPIMTLGLVASMGGFLFGADTGQVSGFIIMEDFVNRFAENRGLGVHSWGQTRVGLIVGTLSIGALVGALMAGPLGNEIGRKKAMIGTCLVYFVGNTISITAQHAWYQIVTGRLFSGIAIGALSGMSTKPHVSVQLEGGYDTDLSKHLFPSIYPRQYLNKCVVQWLQVINSSSLAAC